MPPSQFLNIPISENIWCAARAREGILVVVGRDYCETALERGGMVGGTGSLQLISGIFFWHI